MDQFLHSGVEHLGSLIKALCERLAIAGYVFQYPEEVFPGPEVDAVRAIRRIESEAGEVPLALKLFWRHVGSVNLCGSHPAWRGCKYPDPLVVYPPSVALPDLDDFREEPEGSFAYRPRREAAVSRRISGSSTYPAHLTTYAMKCKHCTGV